MFTALVSGIPEEGLRLVKEASDLSYGADTVSIVEVEGEELRAQVRAASKNTSVVLVVLDDTAFQTVESAGYDESKTFVYKTYEQCKSDLERSLEVTLSDRVIPDLGIQKGTEKTNYIDESKLAATVRDYRDELTSKERIIENLKHRLIEAENRFYSTTSEEEISKSTDKVLELTSLLEEEKKASLVLSATVTDLQKEVDDYAKKMVTLQGRLGESESVRSLQDGVLRNKDSEIEKLKGELRTAYKTQETTDTELSKTRAQMYVLKETVSELEMKAKNAVTLPTDSDSYQVIIDLQKKIKDAEESVKYSAAEVSKVSSERDKYHDELTKLKTVNENLNTLVESLEDSVRQKEELLFEANEKLATRVEVTESVDTETKGNEELVRRVEDLASSPISPLLTRVQPRVSPKIDVLDVNTDTSRVQAVFAGTGDSVHETYKYIASTQRGKTIFVDMSTESYADYVYGISQVVDGTDWLMGGGSITKYLSKTEDPQLSVLSPGQMYLNDLYVLSIDWDSRVRDLSEHPNNVILFFGSITNVVGRVMYTKLAEKLETTVVTKGTPINVRSLYNSLSGIDSKGLSKIKIIAPSTHAQGIIDHLVKTFECETIR